VGGTTVFLSSHLLAEMEQLCDRVAVLASGRVLCEEPLDVILGEADAVIEVSLPEAEVARALGWLEVEHGLRARHLRPDGLEVWAAGCDAAALNRALVEQGFAIAGFAPRRRTLEEVFVELTGEAAEIR
jgi:ABC-2 type transport system ATP-binding protein